MSHSFITFYVSLIISLASAYCTVVGYGSVFTSAPFMTMFIASVIELGRVVLTFDLHHYWKQMPIIKKLPGLAMLIIAMSLSAIGVFGFFANAYAEKTKEVTPIEIQVRQLESEIPYYEDEIRINNEQIASIQKSINSDSMDKAIDKYIEKEYVTKALNIKKDSQKQVKELASQNKEASQKIANIKKQVADLQIEAETKAPSIAHLKYFSKLFGVDNDTSIIIFIVMIMLVFDTLAMYLMITSDWIKSLGQPKNEMAKPSFPTKCEVKNTSFPTKSVKKEETFPPKNVKVEEVTQKPIPQIKEEKNNIEIENKIGYNELSTKDKVDMKLGKNNIDNKVSKLVSLLLKDPSKLDSKSFIESLSKTPLIVSKLIKELGEDNELVVKLKEKLKGR